jgi:uncharacterized protein
MRVAIFSDIHDHIWPLKAALNFLAEEDEEVEALICCGDLCSPFVMARLGKDFAGEIHLVFGNNDADTFRITQLAHQYGERVKLYGELAKFELGGLKFAVNHYPSIARELGAAGNFDVVCFGHNHQREINRFSTRGHEVIMINPGPLMGCKFEEGEPVIVPSTFSILDIEEDDVETYEVKPGAEPNTWVIELAPEKVKRKEGGG